MKNIPKVAIIGAGNVGSTAAMLIARAGIANVVMLDVAQDIAKAKALDISQSLAVKGVNINIAYAKDYKDISGSSIVIITAGLARKPGMSRDDLLKINARIIRQVALEIKDNAPEAMVIVVTNPLDIMTYLVYKLTGFNHTKVFGMAGVLDTARLADFTAVRLGLERSAVKAVVLGSHGDLMVPVFTQSKAGTRPLPELLPAAELEQLSEATKAAGAQIVSLLGAGPNKGASSAYYAPAESVFAMVEAVLNDTRPTFSCCVYLQGEYGLRDIYMGVPCVLGKKGVEKIIELKLSADEAAAFNRAADSIKASIQSLDL